MNILSLTCCFSALFLAGAAVHAANEVWRCKSSAGGAIVFSDVPCPGQGAPVPARQLQSNVVQAQRMPPREAETEALPAPARRENVCPGDQELRNMETQANSSSLSTAASAFLQDEIRRVRQCRKGQGQYTSEDWRISQAARDSQSSPSNQAAARLAAESMHSAADPLEGERIARLREQALKDEQTAARRRKHLEIQFTPPR